MLLEAAHELPEGDTIRSVEIHPCAAYPSLADASNWTWSFGRARELPNGQTREAMYAVGRRLMTSFYLVE
jgi:hypothetical protein